MDTAVSTNIATVVTTEYADDELQSYEEQVNDRLASSISSQEHKITGGRLVGYEEVNAAVDRLACKDCARVEFDKVEDNTMLDFRKFVLSNGSNAETIELINKFQKMRDKSKYRKGVAFKKKTAVHLKDSPIGWSSDMHVQCGSDPSHTFPFTKVKKACKNNKKSKKKNRRRSMDYGDNVMGILAPFLTGTSPTEVSDMGCMLDLPSGNSFIRTIHRNQPLI
jgi:hypothetical protein